MKNSKILLILSACLLINMSYAKTKVKFSGWGTAGFRFIERNPLSDAHQQVYYLGKLQADLEFTDELEAQLDLRGNSITNNVTFREFSVKFKYMEHMHFKMGNIKRPFGWEYVENREDLLTTNRSIVQNNLSIRGYSLRSVSVSAYYNYSHKRQDFPYTYAISIFKDNTFGTGLGLRGLYHINNINFGFGYIFQSISGNYPIKVHGFEIESGYRVENGEFRIGLFYAQDPLRGKEILAQNDAREKEGLPPEESEVVYSAGAVLSGGMKFNTDARVIQGIEPLLLLSFFMPQTGITDNHIIQGIIGVNFYFHENVRLRLNGDLRLTKSEYDEAGEYATDESRGILEVQVRF